MAVHDSRAVTLGLRVSQAVLAIVVLGLTAYVANWWQGYYHGTAPSQIAFLIFCSAWTILALLFLVLVPTRFSESKANHAYAVLAVEGLTMLFWFAGFIAQAAFVSDRVCFGHVCNAAKAAAAFAALAWLVFVFSTILAAMYVVRNHNRNHNHSLKADANMSVHGAV
ncbi:Hypothetical protein R9X50_00184200 [Acrodontium crateriforme]|uniref:MARVEL domain-containing protein n=1 Tax=Acrodontium crateriforme TaxID=150365 RepID=A0AAQ3RAD8_9PEZI|nr:Hypothetical protein R9X50_00184200 [Acrodontium crateriforme]